MAKVGEGDPRWIVSDRKDGANVNAWHWEERDLSRHTHDQLRKRFKGLVLACNTNGVKEIRIDEVSEISGDVTVAQRKGKMMCYFELKMTLKWSGECKEEQNDDACDESDEKGRIKGKMEIFEVDHDTFRDEYDISVSCTENDARASKIENLVRSRGREAVRKEIVKYFNELFEDYHIGQILKANTKMPPPPPPLPTAPSSCACPGIPTTSCSTTTTTSNDQGTKQNECDTQHDNKNKTNTTSHAKSEESTSLSLRMK